MDNPYNNPYNNNLYYGFCMTKILLFSFLQIIINTILVTVHTILVKFSKEHWSIGNNNSKCKLINVSMYIYKHVI